MIDNVTNLRKIQLELLEAFAKACSEHGLKWYVFFGTLLGTVRNEGYLPWDDDVDVVMSAEDYRTLCLHKEWFDEERFFLQTPLDEGAARFATLQRKGTTAYSQPLVESLKAGGRHGIPIDIIPLSEVPGIGYFRTPSLLSEEKQQAVYRKDWLEPAGEAFFEGLKVRIPANPGKVLSAVYEEWAWPDMAMQAKPKYWFFDTQTDDTVYEKRYTGMLDHIEGKKICLFGAADSLRIWLERFGLKEQVLCTFDNDPNKWGKRIFDVEVRDPATLREIPEAQRRVIIVSLWHQAIGKQLEAMGITDYYVFLDFLYDYDAAGRRIERPEPETVKRWRG